VLGSFLLLKQKAKGMSDKIRGKRQKAKDKKYEEIVEIGKRQKGKCRRQKRQKAKGERQKSKGRRPKG
jgi:hypothetical protein